MKNFDEIYKKICEENLKGSDYTITINENILNHTNKKTSNKKPGLIFTLLGILGLLIFITIWISLYFSPDIGKSISESLASIIIYIPLISMLMLGIGQYIKRLKYKKTTLKNPNQKAYQEISNTKFDKIRLKNLKKSHTQTALYYTSIIGGFLLGLYFKSLLLSMLFIFLYFFIPLLTMIINPKITDSYNQKYKENIINSLIKNYDNNLKFSYSHSIARKFYDMSEFENYDIFSSNDYIYGNLDEIIPMQLGDVLTENRHTDSNGNTTYTTVFRGLFSVIKLPTNLQSTIKIHSDKGKLAKFFSNEDSITLDSQEFEKYFDIFSENKVLTMQILTSDIMQYLLTFKLNNNITFEITLKNSFAYLRIHCDDMFEGELTKNAFDYDTLYTYFKYLDFMCELNKKIFYVLQEKDI